GLSYSYTTNGGTILKPYPFAIGNFNLGGGTLGPINATFDAFTQAFNTPGLNIGRIPLNFQVSGTIDPIHIFPGGLTFPANQLLNLDINAGSRAVNIPAITFPQIQASADGTVNWIASNIPLVNVPANPGFFNTTATPSSGFFNSGAGGGSGFG